MFPYVETFYDPSAGTVSHIVYAGYGSPCAVIDPVLDFDAATSTHSIERLVAFVEKKRLEVEWILQTHAHAGHLSGASVLNGRVGGKTGIGRSIVDVRSMLSATLDLSSEHGFDHLFAPDEVFFIGTLQAQVLAMPEPAPFDAAFMIEDALFVVDTLFMPEVGAWRRVCVRGPASLAWHACRFPSHGTRTCLGRQDR
ncbi:MBL fold metallo-hydrolase [Paraburkholderia youngii]|uniref:MBL fold metallo-hydrolase n=1 Tax=Paraburkholderia youngii TaxID=2782701 RepID=A0ABX2NWS3_9BURK|nr:MBL fold metallo-hydrolase [Paraburkholderia youngii]NVI08966.1 MBL fold metallo-hydrolase [Paraburkholderia youngii]